MSILTKPYKISVWEDIFIDGQLQETCLGVIGSNEMLTQSRALEPTLVRNVNGVKKLTFKMYKHYIDNTTGEKVTNPFVDWMISERKVKLLYDGKWYDFIIKDINENSSNYLYTYSLEDALVQELSKNGFGVTLDAELMNNIGNAKELGTSVLADTGWEVESEVFVQTVDEALVYITVPAGTVAQHIIDQTSSNLNQGITTESYTFSEAKTVLAFYSSCKNKPHRFQFIYSSNGYNRDGGKYKISRKDDRTIDEPNCQYYIDYDIPETAYKAATGTYTKELDLFLPDGFGDGVVGADISGKSSNDSQLSSWYRGKRYGFAQQSVYVPILERYCQKFRREEKIPLVKDKNIFRHGSDGEVQVTISDGASSTFSLAGGISTEFGLNGTTSEVQSVQMKKKHKWVGLRLELEHHDYDEYVLKYDLTVNAGTLQTIGGHNAHYEPISYKVLNSSGVDLAEKLTQTGSYVTLGGDPIKNGTYNVEIRYKRRASTNGQKHLFLQPNRDTETYIDCEISNLSITMEGDYLGYTESEFVSPTLVQNYVTNYKFESTGGWTATASSGQVSKEKAKVENFYGRFDEGDGDDDGEFVTISEDFYSGEYDEETEYHAGLKMSFFNQNQFVLNSGIRDNRSIIVEMPKDEKWVLDYKIVDSSNNPANNAFNISLGEYLYNTDTGGYNEKTGHISFTCANATGTDRDNIPTDYERKIITVSDSKYTKDTFKKDSKIYLKFQPTSVETVTVGEEVTPQVWYLEGASLYRRAVDDKGKIIIPDYEVEDSLAAEEYIKQGAIAHKYHYFNRAFVTGSNAVTDKEKLATMIRETLDYTDYKPVYNTGAEKVRSVTVKESNYFNILQSIAETFEAWLDFEITRNDETGAVTSKKVKFKNYIGKNNYANFRYGVNLKDIQRTYSSKNIVTKLIVKQNSNELAENSFCTIQRAGANPTGENYIYDFQYYQNTGIMDASDYLNTAYYLDGAFGPDAELWNDTSKVGRLDSEHNTTLNGYYQRVKKINDALLPINEEIIGHRADLVKKKAELEVAEATKAASAEGIEQTAENFLALTGIYPEEALTGQITSIALDIKDGNHGITKSEEWWDVETNPILVANGLGYRIEVKVSSYNETCHAKIVEDQGTTMTQLTGDGVQIEKSSEYTGIYLEEQWEDGRKYTLTYDLEVLEGTLLSFGGHAACFKDYKYTVESNDPKISHTQEFESSVENRDSAFRDVKKYKITFTGTYVKPSGTPGYSGEHDLWIQPNRAKAGTIKCEISNIKLTKEITENEATKSYDRNAHFYLNVEVGIGTKEDGTVPRTTINRTYDVTCKVPANATSATVEQGVSSVDTESSNVKKYIEEYTLYYEKLESSTNDVNRITPQITAIEQAIKEKEERKNTLLEYKKLLNKLFFKKYSRFILEGTWINEEYVDDDKYFADAQSVLYNSCYPQAVYNINVLSLKGLPGYELIDFDIGDKTYVIDEEFFGENYQEEVIITEMSEILDDPSKNSIKVQNFKNQFQDLFQKITATVQQTQYNVGSYEKGAALVDANYKKQNEWITKAINNAESYLQYGQTVTTDDSGITIVDSSNKQNKLRLVGGAILFSVEKPDKDDTTWMTGITNSGISANLVTTGRLDTGAVQIMSGDSPVFRWDAYGISAYDAYWNSAGGINTISGINTKKFVRFDKNGIYGINNVSGIDGATWHPSDDVDGKTAAKQIDENATFALTWEGLKVTGDDGITARLGKYVDEEGNGSIIKVSNGAQDTFLVKNNGDVEIAGKLKSATGLFSGNLQTGGELGYSWTFDTAEGLSAKYNNQEYFNLKDGAAFLQGKIVSTSGSIGGWDIRDTSLIGGEHGSSLMGLFTDYKGLPQDDTLAETTLSAGGSGSKSDWRVVIGNNKNYKFGVDSEGAVYCSDIKASGGSVGGWNIRDTSLIGGYHGSSLMGLFTDYMGLPKDGALAETELSVGGSDLKDDWRLVIGSNTDYKFGVDSEGVVYCSDIKASGGSVGGWSIKDNVLYTGKAFLSGSSKGPQAPSLISQGEASDTRVGMGGSYAQQTYELTEGPNGGSNTTLKCSLTVPGAQLEIDKDYKDSISIIYHNLTNHLWVQEAKAKTANTIEIILHALLSITKKYIKFTLAYYEEGATSILEDGSIYCLALSVNNILTPYWSIQDGCIYDSGGGIRFDSSGENLAEFGFNTTRDEIITQKLEGVRLSRNKYEYTGVEFQIKKLIIPESDYWKIEFHRIQQGDSSIEPTKVSMSTLTGEVTYTFDDGIILKSGDKFVFGSVFSSTISFTIEGTSKETTTPVKITRGGDIEIGGQSLLAVIDKVNKI